jgi:solute:Na+ symporter, SSS family
MGLVTVMYSAQKGFAMGFAAFHIALVAAVVSLVVGLTGFIVVPLRRSGVMTIPEFYERRFGKGVRLVGGAILAFSGILNMGMFLKADSLFVTSVMGVFSDFELKLAMTIMLALVLVYTMLGGMIAVLVTDYMQFVVMAIGLVVTSVFLMGQYGWSDILATVHAVRGEAGFNPFCQSGFGGPYVAWMFFLSLISCCIWQTSVMRASSAEDEKVVRKTFALGSVGFLIRFLVPYFWGICAMVYICQKPELARIFIEPKEVPSSLSLRAMPIALSNLLPAGAIGILTAGMLAAAMSTYNTYLHCWSTVLTQDVVAPLRRREMSSRSRIVCARILMVFIGIFLLVWGLWYPLGEDLWDYMAVTGAIYFTGAFAVLLTGIYWPRASRAGAYGAFACGFLAVLGLSPVQAMLGLEWGSEFVGLGTVLLALIAMVGGSLLFPDSHEGEPGAVTEAAAGPASSGVVQGDGGDDCDEGEGAA